MNVRRNRNIDVVRILLCAAVFLYHLNLLRGGYLAVCGFFALSGYFTASSLQKHGTDSILKYCCRRITTIYVPLFVAVCLTVLAVSLLPSFHWISLKPETTSVFLCFNNFYQIAARQDYFARAASSPLIHMWYLSILIQYDLVYPIVYAVGKKLFGKRHAG
ncbi:MAG: acyltransferase, partial [Erysipelotrichaceae bacterium]|nr:acyltransferase [Erysipelotrichaceae bacterium]